MAGIGWGMRKNMVKQDFRIGFLGLETEQIQ